MKRTALGVSLALAASVSLAPMSLVGAASAADRPWCQGQRATVGLAKGERPTQRADVIVGTPGPDVIRGRGGDDIICGRGGDDRIQGGPGNDRIDGGAGDDRLQGGPGHDRLRGQGGDDLLDGRGGNDVLPGGSGRDTASYLTAARGVRVNLGHRDPQPTGAGADTLRSVENLLGSRHDDVLIGDHRPNTISGGEGDDLISGRGGVDTLDGEGGTDQCSTGDDSLSGATCEALTGHRVLIIGDSITHGSDGDFTWRYRLDQHLAHHSSVDFVGPRTDLWNLVTTTGGSQAYVDRSFDRDHAARWGQSLVNPTTPLPRLVEDHVPDVVIELLGTNDLAFGHRQAAEVTLDRVDEFVERARAIDPTIAFVVGTTPVRVSAESPEFNRRLPDRAARLDRARSPVRVAGLHKGFVPDDHTYDTMHPNARGEILIAAAVADALADLGVGIPMSPRTDEVAIGPRWVSDLEGSASSGQATLTWRTLPGVTHNIVWRRDVTGDGEWIRLGQVTGTSFTNVWLLNGRTYEFRLQPAKVYAESELRSNIVALTPQRAPAPE